MKKAMLLAAGRGERLRPLTNDMPKPLIKVGSKSLIENNLEQLKNAGVEEVVINVFYYAKDIVEAVGNGDRFGLKVTFSYEPDQPLGTGGGIFQALRFLGNEPFILLSSDIWTDYPLGQLSLGKDKLAHLVMVDNPHFHPDGDYFLSASGLLNKSSQPKLTFGSIAVIHPQLFKGCQPGVFSLAPLLEAGMQKQEVTGELFHGCWFNVGTVDELKRLEQSLA